MRAFEALIFEGGGSKGVAHTGALKELHDSGRLAGIRRFAGSSAGAITALLLAADFTPCEIGDIVTRAPWAELLHDRCGVIRDIYRLVRNFGLYQGDVMRNYLNSVLEKRFGIADMTFEQLYALTSNELRMGACDVQSSSFVFLDRSSTPDMPVALAAQASAAIPLIFAAVPYGSALYCDGGVLGNLPGCAFPDHFALALELVGPAMPTADMPEHVGNYMYRVVDMMMTATQKVHGKNALKNGQVLEITIPQGFRSLETKVVGNYADTLSALGAQAARDFFTRKR